MKRPSVKVLLLCAGLFLLLVVLRFPYRTLRGYVFSKIYKETRIRVDAADLSPVLLGWPGVRLSEASIGIPMQRHNSLNIQCQRLTVRSSLMSLFPPAPAVSLYMQRLVEGGDVYVRFGQNASRLMGQVEGRKVNLAQFDLPGLPEPLRGILSADGAFVIDKKNLQRSTGGISIQADTLRIPAQNLQGIILPVFEMQDLRAKLAIVKEVLEIKEFRFGKEGADVSGTLAGEIRLGKTLPEFFINLVLRIQLSEQYRNAPSSATLVSFLNSFKTGTPGDYAMKWSASIGEMQRNLMSALPRAL